MTKDPSRLFPELGSALSALRVAHGFKTQQDLADAMGKTRQSVQRWEKGETPSASALAALRQVLGPDVWRVVERPLAIPPEGLDGARYALGVFMSAAKSIQREIERTEASLPDANLAARAIATHKAAPPATAKGSSTPARRPRRAQG